MTHRNMMWLVAIKEIKTILRNKRLLIAGLYVSGIFGAMNLLFSGSSSPVTNALFVASLLPGIFVGYSFSRFVFFREKQEKLIETLLCTPLSVKSIWLGKSLGAAVPAYVFSLLAVALVMITSSLVTQSLIFPSAAILLHIVGVAPVFTVAVIGLMGVCQFLLGLRENTLIGYVILLVVLPFLQPSLFGLLLGDVNAVVSWLEVGICFLFAVLLVGLTASLSRYLSKEKIVTTIPSD